MFNPAWVIDQFLERTAQFHGIVQLLPCIRSIVATLRVAVPLAMSQGRDSVYGAVQLVDEIPADGILEHEIPAKVQEVIIKRRRFYGLHHRLPRFAVTDKKLLFGHYRHTAAETSLEKHFHAGKHTSSTGEAKHEEFGASLWSSLLP
jgi:hypothetical protein